MQLFEAIWQKTLSMTILYVKQSPFFYFLMNQSISQSYKALPTLSDFPKCKINSKISFSAHSGLKLLIKNHKNENLTQLLQNLKKHKNQRIKKIATRYISMPRKDYKIISVRIDSTWGESSEIKILFLSLFDYNRKPIEIKNISSIPDVSSLELLLNPDYYKEEGDVFCEKFYKNFTIFLAVEKDAKIQGIRIFNSSTKSPSSVKNVSIYEGNTLLVKDEVPWQFGINLMFQPDLFQGFLTSQVPKVTIYKDSYGIFPIKMASQLKISVIQTYNRDNKIGLNGFDIFDLSGKQIPNDHIQKIILSGIINHNDIEKLMKRNKISNDFNDMFQGETENDKEISFTIKFHYPEAVSIFQIWNYNAAQGNLNYGISKLKIFVDNDLIQMVRVPRGHGFTQYMTETKKAIAINEFFQKNNKIQLLHI